MPEFEGRPARKVVLSTPPGELTQRARGRAHRALPDQRRQVPGRARDRLPVARSPPGAAPVPAHAVPPHRDRRGHMSPVRARLRGRDGRGDRCGRAARPSTRDGRDGCGVDPTTGVRALRQVRRDLDRRDAGAQRRRAPRPRHGARLRMRMRTGDPPLATDHGRAAVRVRLQPAAGAVVLRAPAVRRLPRERAGAAAPLRRRLVRLRLLAVDLHPSRRRSAATVDGGTGARRQAWRPSAGDLPRPQPRRVHAHGRPVRADRTRVRGGRAGGDRRGARRQQRVRRLPPGALYSRGAGPGTRAPRLLPGGALDIQQDAVLFRKPGPR